MTTNLKGFNIVFMTIDYVTQRRKTFKKSFTELDSHRVTVRMRTYFRSNHLKKNEKS